MSVTSTTTGSTRPRGCTHLARAYFSSLSAKLPGASERGVIRNTKASLRSTARLIRLW